MEEKQLFCKPTLLNQQTDDFLGEIRWSFEDRLFLEAICHSEFPDRLRKRKPKTCDRIQGKLESIKKELVNLYRKENKKLKPMKQITMDQRETPQQLIPERSNTEVCPVKNNTKEAR